MSARLGNRIRSLFVARDVLFHDGNALRRVSLTGRRQATLAAAATLTLGFQAMARRRLRSWSSPPRMIRALRAWSTGSTRCRPACRTSVTSPACMPSGSNSARR
ncbi:hypothetical protein MOP88_08920 [Sphingomonas sp. WKB10]|nr:hypothetical protein [Sphingomonas sp. WKB10]